MSIQNRRAQASTAQSTQTGRKGMHRIRRKNAGFTLVELMIVMAIIMVLAVVAVPSYIAAMRSAREAVLKEDLHVLRNAIDSYTADKPKAPQGPDDLGEDGYLKTL